MTNLATIRVDEKGRLSIPAKARKELGISPGDVLFFRIHGGMLQYAKMNEDPFEILARQAVQEFEEGKTVSIEEYARKKRIPLKAKTAKRKSRV